MFSITANYLIVDYSNYYFQRWHYLMMQIMFLFLNIIY